MSFYNTPIVACLSACDANTFALPGPSSSALPQDAPARRGTAPKRLQDPDVEQLLAEGKRHRLCLTSDTELPQDVLDVCADRPSCDEQTFRDLLRTKPVGEKLEDLLLPLRELGRSSCDGPCERRARFLTRARSSSGA